jgi:hypothetical protein
MEQLFRNIGNIYKDYKRQEIAFNKAYKALAESGDYSQKRLNNEKRQLNEKIRQERTAVAGKLNKVRNEIVSELDKKYSLDGLYNSVTAERVKSYLNSGINLTPREFESLAIRYKDDIVISRLIHDTAESRGYDIDNYTPYEQAVQDLDNLIHRTQTAVDNSDNLMLSPYQKIDDCIADCGRVYGGIVNHNNIKCLPLPKDLETAISNDNIRNAKEPTAEETKAFYKGFTGQEPPTALETAINGLTAQEKIDAKVYSTMNGRKGEITQAEVDYISSSEYKEFSDKRRENTEKAETN